MSTKPLFTLRGHTSGVTALCHTRINNNSYVLSGDEQGNIFVWDLSIFRKLTSHQNLLVSRVQSLRALSLTSDHGDVTKDILVAQSRNDGVFVFDLKELLMKTPSVSINYPVYGHLFSRGDAIVHGKTRAILAYPSQEQNDVVTVRIVDHNVNIRASNIALRPDKCGSVFDIKLSRGRLLLVGYEDGCLAVFSLHHDPPKDESSTSEGDLIIKLAYNIDTKLKDFISAFDMSHSSLDTFTIVIGSASNDLLLHSYDEGHSLSKELARIDLKKPGVSTLAIRPDDKLVVVAGWNTQLKLYSLKSHKFLLKSKYHTKQIQDIVFIRDPICSQLVPEAARNANSLFCCASQDGLISIFSFY